MYVLSVAILYTQNFSMILGLSIFIDSILNATFLRHLQAIHVKSWTYTSCHISSSPLEDIYSDNHPSLSADKTRFGHFPASHRLHYITHITITETASVQSVNKDQCMHGLSSGSILAHHFDVTGGGSRVETPEGTTSQRILGPVSVRFSGIGNF